MPRINITSITCHVPDESDKDEMYLKYKGEKIWPTDSSFFRIDVDENVAIHHTFEVNEDWVELELWDWDLLSANDHLGTFKFKVDDLPGAYSTTMIRNHEETQSASYLMHWEILKEEDQ
ncbi:MAG: hypothetical protein AAF789_08055 [Bacteroidota bacterium]